MDGQDQNGSQLIQHHLKYREIDGVDEIVMMTRAEHDAMHKKLRREGKGKLTYKELAPISTAAHNRSEMGKARQRAYQKTRAHYKLTFRTKVGTLVR